MQRRDLIRFTALAACGTVVKANALSGEDDGTPLHHPARAKRVIFLCMNGGPSHVDLFDYKPELVKRNGQQMHGAAGPSWLAPAFPGSQQGQSGMWISEKLPALAEEIDRLCMLHGMYTDLPNHSQAFKQLHTGSFQFDRPSLGAWVLYGLGPDNPNLPGFVTINPPADNGGAVNYGCSFLPAQFQGTKIGTNQIPRFYAKMLGVDQEPGPALRNVANERMGEADQRALLDFTQTLNHEKLSRDIVNRDVEGAIDSLELAFRMQGELPQVLDVNQESQQTLASYGIGSGLPTDQFGKQCLMARRLVEAGVRFVEVTPPVNWDHHFRLQEEIDEACTATDRPIAGLLSDLATRGLLEDTLVVWAGEFGRTPYAQGFAGRDHNHLGFTVWMAGGGVRGGMSYGATDEFGHKAVESRTHVHDLHATILHLLGLDHERLTFSYGGRAFRLTDVHGLVVQEIIA